MAQHHTPAAGTPCHRLNDPNDLDILVAEPEVTIEDFTELPQLFNLGNLIVQYELVVVDGAGGRTRLVLPQNFEVNGRRYGGGNLHGAIILKRMIRVPAVNDQSVVLVKELNTYEGSPGISATPLESDEILLKIDREEQELQRLEDRRRRTERVLANIDRDGVAETIRPAQNMINELARVTTDGMSGDGEVNQ